MGTLCTSKKFFDDPRSDPVERFEAMKEWMREMLDAWGLDDVNVRMLPAIDEEGNHHWAYYDADNNTIHMDPHLFDGSQEVTWADVSNSASHEIWHAMQEELYNSYGLEFTRVDYGVRHEEAKDFAEAMDDELEDPCDDDDDESAPWDKARERQGEPASPMGDWNLPADGGISA